MKQFLATGIAGIALFTLPHLAFAQTDDTALGQAKSRLACGAGTVVASVFLPNGSLQVTCAQPPSNAASSTLQATGLTTTVGVASVSVVTVLTILTGGGGSGTTSTTMSSK